uniref:transposase n=1 Tax=Succinivibrio sp. TaxID=2053619 RepID=UPI00402AC7C5
MVSHAKYPLSNGKVKGVNQKIKTIRRKSYGLPYDEYFCLNCLMPQDKGGIIGRLLMKDTTFFRTEPKFMNY